MYIISTHKSNGDRSTAVIFDKNLRSAVKTFLDKSRNSTEEVVLRDNGSPILFRHGEGVRLELEGDVHDYREGGKLYQILETIKTLSSHQESISMYRH